MKIMTIVGARPQFIKAASVSRAIMQDNSISEIMVHTGQHYDANMSDIFFEELGIPAPAYHLGIGGGSHGRNTGRMLEEIELSLLKEKPDAVLVYGDTDSTLAGALAASKLHIKLIHVEAGLRSYNRAMPEEINRKLTDHVSDLLLAPTQAAIKNLALEGVQGRGVINVGDVMFDAVLHYYDQAKQKSTILQSLSLMQGKYTLATIHRQENTDDVSRLANILTAFEQSGRQIILPLHPRTRQKIAGADLVIPTNCVVIDPVGYLDMIMLEKHAELIVTDSGGVQKEAFFHQVPCVTLRDETEWVELVELGWNHLASPENADLTAILQTTFSPGDTKALPYGDGHAATKIISAIHHFLVH